MVVHMTEGDTLWRGREAVLSTMHGKESVIGPLLYEGMGLSVVVPKDFDTDQFGTFTREKRRLGTPLETARAKAAAALSLTGHDIAIASEGSFGAHPSVPFLSHNSELVLLIDTKHNLEIAGYFETTTVMARGQSVRTPEEAVAVARAWGFPEQGVILRTSEVSNDPLLKELRSEEELRRACIDLLAKWFVRSVFLETDMRAHRCPARRESITAATRVLVENCRSTCPQCSTPGFRVTSVERGLPCRDCHAPTDRVLAYVRVCQRCQYTTREPVEVVADQSECQWCNP
jgi:hypothetical protein